MENENSGQWAVVELMGRKVVSGLIQKSVELGPPMLRVDVPATSEYPAFTQFYGETSLYCVTMVSEEVAGLTAEQCKVNPVSVYVPNLISREKHEDTIRQMKETLSRLLPAGREPFDDDSEEQE